MQMVRDLHHVQLQTRRNAVICSAGVPRLNDAVAKIKSLSCLAQTCCTSVRGSPKKQMTKDFARLQQNGKPTTNNAICNSLESYAIDGVYPGHSTSNFEDKHDDVNNIYVVLDS